MRLNLLRFASMILVLFLSRSPFASDFEQPNGDDFEFPSATDLLLMNTKGYKKLKEEINSEIKGYIQRLAKQRSENQAQKEVIKALEEEIEALKINLSIRSGKKHRAKSEHDDKLAKDDLVLYKNDSNKYRHGHILKILPGNMVKVCLPKFYNFYEDSYIVEHTLIVDADLLHKEITAGEAYEKGNKVLYRCQGRDLERRALEGKILGVFPDDRVLLEIERLNSDYSDLKLWHVIASERDLILCGEGNND